MQGNVIIYYLKLNYDYNLLHYPSFIYNNAYS